MANQKLWYKIWLDNGHEITMIAEIKSPGLATLTLNYLKTVYPEERLFKLWKE